MLKDRGEEDMTMSSKTVKVIKADVETRLGKHPKGREIGVA
jgi:hypothetical protein